MRFWVGLILAALLFCGPALAEEGFAGQLPMEEASVYDCSSRRSTSCSFRYLAFSSRGFEKRDLELVWIEMNDADTNFVVAPTRSAVDPTRRKGPPLEQLLAAGGRAVADVVVAMNGSFAARDSKCHPEGLEVSQGRFVEDKISAGRILDRYREQGGHLFQTLSGKLEIEEVLDHTATGRLVSAVQSPVLLLQDGKIHGRPNRVRRQDRLAIGVGEGGVITVVLAYDDGLTIGELADFLLRSSKDGGPGLTDALLLEGYPAGVYFPERENPRFFGSNGPSACIANILLFQRVEKE